MSAFLSCLLKLLFWTRNIHRISLLDFYGMKIVRKDAQISEFDGSYIGKRFDVLYRRQFQKIEHTVHDLESHAQRPVKQRLVFH